MTYADQAEPDSVDFDILVAPFALTAVISGTAVSAQGTPDGTVAVASGIVMVNDAVQVISSGNVDILGAGGAAADATNPRFDLVVASDSGTKLRVGGTASANPVFPAIPANRVVLAAIYVPANATTITSAQIIDKRVIMAQRKFTIQAVFKSPSGADDVFVWRCPYTSTLTNLRAYQDTGTGTVVNAFRGSLASPTLYRASDYTISAADTI